MEDGDQMDLFEGWGPDGPVWRMGTWWTCLEDGDLMDLFEGWGPDGPVWRMET